LKCHYVIGVNEVKEDVKVVREEKKGRGGYIKLGPI
jgi:hypothetical protein